MHSHLVKVDGMATHYLEGGPAEAPVVVLIHDGAFGADAQVTWGPILEPLSARFHVYAPDLLGFGRTQKVYDFTKDARRQRIDHISRWLNVFGIETASFIGSSMGGGLVMLAAAYRLWPLQKGVSIAGTAGPYQVSKRYEELRDYDASESEMRRIVEAMVRRRDEVADQLVRDRHARSLIPGHWENLSAPRLRNPAAARGSSNWLAEYLAALATVEVPILLIAGSDDALLEPGWEAKLAAHVPNCRAHVVRGGRHQPHLDEPEEVASLLVAFLES